MSLNIALANFWASCLSYIPSYDLVGFFFYMALNYSYFHKSLLSITYRPTPTTEES